jgi:hypothetical protein
MSRGPGKLERTIAAEFAAHPDDALAIEALALACYPGINRVEKKHRIAVARAAKSVCGRTGWGWYIDARQGGKSIYFHQRSLRSYAFARLRNDFCKNNLSDEELRQLIDGKADHRRYHSIAQSLGAFANHVRAWRVFLDGNEDEKAAMRIEVAERNAAIRAVLGLKPKAA